MSKFGNAARRTGTENEDRAVDTHVMPEFENELEHDDSINCWCEPVLIYVDPGNGKRVWSHRRPE